MIKYALCEAHAEIQKQSIRHKVEDGEISIFDGAYMDGYTGDSSETLVIFDTFGAGYKALSEEETTADIAYTGFGKILNCWLVWLEERVYDEFGEYNLTGREWRANEREV